MAVLDTRIYRHINRNLFKQIIFQGLLFYPKKYIGIDNIIHKDILNITSTTI